MAQHVSQVKLKQALKHNVTPAAKELYEPGGSVFVWRENLFESRISEWIGPYVVTSFDGMAWIVFVLKFADSAPQRFNITQVKPFISHEPAVTEFMNTVDKPLKVFNFPVTIAIE